MAFLDIFGIVARTGSTTVQTIQDAFARLIRNTACLSDFGGDPTGVKLAGDGTAVGFTSTAGSANITVTVATGVRPMRSGDIIQLAGAGALDAVTGIPGRFYATVDTVGAVTSGSQTAVLHAVATTAISFGTVIYGADSTAALKNLVLARKRCRLDNPFSRTTSSTSPLVPAIYLFNDTITPQPGTKLTADSRNAVELVMMDDSKPAFKWLGSNNEADDVDMYGFALYAKYGIQVNELSWTLSAAPSYSFNLHLDISFNPDWHFSFYSPEGIIGLTTVTAAHQITDAGWVHVDPDWRTTAVPATTGSYVNANSSYATMYGFTITAPGYGYRDLAYLQQLHNLGCNVYLGRVYNFHISHRSNSVNFGSGIGVFCDGSTNGVIGGMNRYSGVAHYVCGQFGDGDNVTISGEVKQFYRQNYITLRDTTGDISCSFENGLNSYNVDGSAYTRNGTYLYIGNSNAVTFHDCKFLDNYVGVPGVYIEASNYGLHATDNTLSCDTYVEQQTIGFQLGPLLTASGNTYQLRGAYRKFTDFPGVVEGEPDPYVFNKNSPGGYQQEQFVGGAGQWTNTGVAAPDWTLSGSVEPSCKLRTALKSASHKKLIARFTAGRIGAGAGLGNWGAAWQTTANSTEVFTPSTGSHTLTADSRLFKFIISVYKTGTQTTLRGVVGTPAAGEYSLTGTVMSFNSAEAATSITVIYTVATTRVTWTEPATSASYTVNFGGIGTMTDMGAKLANGTALTLTSGTPSAGQYKVTSSTVSSLLYLTYTFNSADMAGKPSVTYVFVTPIFQSSAGNLGLTTGGLEQRTVKVDLSVFDTADPTGLLLVFLLQQSSGTPVCETQEIRLIPDIGASPMFEDPANSFRYVGAGELAVRKITSDLGFIDVGTNDVRGTSMDGFETVGFGTDQTNNGSFNFWRKANGDGTFTRFYLQLIDDSGTGVPRRMSFRTQQISAVGAITGDTEIVAFRGDFSLKSHAPTTDNNTGLVNSLTVSGVKVAGDVTLAAGTGATLALSGQTITISASGAGGGLVAANNLSDVASAATSRANISAVTRQTGIPATATGIGSLAPGTYSQSYVQALADQINALKADRNSTNAALNL